jgi:6-phosphofructokinase 1
VKAGLGKSTRVRADTFGYLQRSFPGTVSAQDALEAREVGRRAVAYAMGEDRPSGSVVIRRAEGVGYRPEYALAPLENLAQKTRVLPEEFLRGNNDVSPAFLEWLQPLVGEIPQPGLLAGKRLSPRVSS